MLSLRKSTSMMLSWSVIIALMGCFVLSADAILCHQCNSHLEEDCNDLKLTVPRGVRDDQFLAECPPRNNSDRVFCRKTVTVINVNHEKRVVRGCGWDTEDLHGRNDTCIAADNEGFTEEICACFSEGCNSAPLSGPSSVAVTLGAGALALVVAAIRRG